MKTAHFTDVKEETPPVAGAQATIRWLVAEKDGAKNFAMRVIEIKRRGVKIPLHQHNYEHEIFIIEGRGSVLSQSGERPVAPGDFVFVQPDEMHGFENAGDQPFRFICVVPILKK